MDLKKSDIFRYEYDSPINMIVQKISNAVSEKTDDAIYKAVLNTGINIDKDKLVQALTMDQQRYRGAYSCGYQQAIQDINIAEVILLDDIKNHDDVWLETVDIDSHGKEVHSVRLAFVMNDYGSFIVFCYPLSKASFATVWPSLMKDQYDKAWRCWDRKPTEQQMIDRDDEVPFYEE